MKINKCRFCKKELEEKIFIVNLYLNNSQPYPKYENLFMCFECYLSYLKQIYNFSEKEIEEYLDSILGEKNE